jgi:hypothetical protein
MLKYLAGVLIFLTLLGVGIIHKKSPPQDRKKEKQERGGKVYKGLGGSRPKLHESVEKEKGDIKLERELSLPVLSPNPAPFRLRGFLNEMACDADAVIVGRVTGITTHPTEDQTFVYSNNTVRIEEVLKDNPAAPILADTDLTVIRSGGTIKIGGRKIIARDQSLLPLAPGQRYVLFLQFVPERNVYAANESRGSFLLTNVIIKLTKEQLPKELESGNDATTFVAEVRGAAADACPGTTGGKR